MAIKIILRLGILSVVPGILFSGNIVKAEGTLSSERLDALYSPFVRAAIQPELILKQQPMEPISDDTAQTVDWLDIPLCHPETPVPEEKELPSVEAEKSETVAMNRLLPPSGVYPAGSGMFGGSFGSLGSAGFTPGGGGAGGGFPSFSPTANPPTPSPTGGAPVIVGPTGGPVSPEPASIVLFGSGLVGVVAAARRKFR